MIFRSFQKDADHNADGGGSALSVTKVDDVPPSATPVRGAVGKC